MLQLAVRHRLAHRGRGLYRWLLRSPRGHLSHAVTPGRLSRLEVTLSEPYAILRLAQCVGPLYHRPHNVLLRLEVLARWTLAVEQF